MSDSLPPEYALRKKGIPVRFNDKYHVSHRESRKRYYYRQKWLKEHEKEDQKGYEEAVFENTETVPEETLRQWDEERKELGSN